MASIPRNRSLLLVGLILLAAMPAGAQPPNKNILTLERSVALALQNNPELAVFRAQRGSAAAGVVIARTYPFNPVFASAVMPDSGPISAGVTNRVFNQNTLSQEIEVFGQGKIRRAVADAALSRVEWEIAAQEQQLAVRTIRAFHAYLYRQEKLRVLDETIHLQEQTTQKVKRLSEQGKLKVADFLLARSDELEARAQRGARQTQALAAWHDLLRLLGAEQQIAEVNGRLHGAAPQGLMDDWTPIALRKRPDLQAAHLAYLEADERERLEIANRFGNPTIGAKTEYNETRVAFFGATVQLPVPVYNLRRGEILQRQAEKIKVLRDQERIATQINQEVQAALDHLQEAKKWVLSFESDILPTLRKTLDAFDQLFAQGDPSVDVMRLIDVRRRYLRARDSYLDALWELTQARADLAAAVGDFTLASSEAAPPNLGAPENGRPDMLPR